MLYFYTAKPYIVGNDNTCTQPQMLVVRIGGGSLLKEVPHSITCNIISNRCQHSDWSESSE